MSEITVDEKILEQMIAKGLEDYLNKNLLMNRGEPGNQGCVAIGNACLINLANSANHVGIGVDAGIDQLNGEGMTFLGAKTNVTKGDFSYSTAIGYGAVITDNNQLSIGSPEEGKGVNYTRDKYYTYAYHGYLKVLINGKYLYLSCLERNKEMGEDYQGSTADNGG